MSFGSTSPGGLLALDASVSINCRHFRQILDEADSLLYKVLETKLRENDLLGEECFSLSMVKGVLEDHGCFRLLLYSVY